MPENSAWTSLPRSPGAYLLLMEVVTPLQLSVGRLGEFTLAPGRYAYIGSAQGPGGLRARVGRHLNPGRRAHWHIDALTTRAPIMSIWAVESTQPLECAWVHWLSEQPGSTTPIPGFGASDCRAGCPAHLMRVDAGLNPGTWHAAGRQFAAAPIGP